MRVWSSRLPVIRSTTATRDQSFLGRTCWVPMAPGVTTVVIAARHSSRSSALATAGPLVELRVGSTTRTVTSLINLVIAEELELMLADGEHRGVEGVGRRGRRRLVDHPHREVAVAPQVDRDGLAPPDGDEIGARTR